MKHIFLALLFSSYVFAHQSSVTESGKQIVLPNPSLELYLKNNPTFIDFNKTKAITEKSIQQWNSPTSLLNLRLSNTPTINQIQFLNDFSKYGSAVIGITELSYNKEGFIQKALIKLNNNYFLNEDKDSHTRGGIYLGDVLTHELGHFIGLNHSEVLNSSMFFESFPGQATLSRDDIAGVQSLYSSDWGRISGTIMGGNQVPVLGAQVKAISRLSGQAISSVSNEDGRFDITGLDINDSYYLYISPTKKINDLPSYFANAQNNFCPGSYKGGFFTACGIDSGGSAQAITLTSNKRAVEVGVVSVNCSLRSSPEYAQTKLEENADPILIWDSLTEDKYEKNHIGYFFNSNDWTSWDKFRVDLQDVDSTNTSLKIDLIGHAFGSPMEYELSVLRGDDVITTLIVDEDINSQTYNHNLSYELPLDIISSQNNYEIHIRARNLADFCSPGVESPCKRWSYPALDQFINKQEAPYLLSLGLIKSSIPLFNTQQVLSDNASCLDAPFTYRVTKNISTLSEDSQKAQVDKSPLSCATIEPPSSSGPPGGGLLSLCLGFMLASLSLLLKKSKNTLS